MLEIIALQGENLNRDPAVGIGAEVFLKAGCLE